MNKFIKWALIGSAGIVVLVIAILIAIPFFVDLNRYKPLMEEKVAAATGRTFKIGSDLNLSLFPWAGVSFSDLMLGNPEGFEEDAFVRIDSFEVRVKLLPLLSKQVEVQKFIVSGPQVKLIKRRDGRVNWDFAKPPETAPAPESKKEAPPTSESSSELPIEKLAVGNFNIQNGLILYIDQGAGSRTEVADFNLTIRDVSFDNPIPITMSARIDEYPLQLEGTIGPTGSNPGRGSVPLDLSIKALDELNLTLTGKVNNAAGNPQIEIAANATPFSLRKLMGRLGMEQTIQTADPNVLQKVAFEANINADPKTVALSQGKLELDDSNLQFSMQASQFDRPNLAFNLDLDRIDLDRYLPPAEKPEPDSAPTKQDKGSPGTQPESGKIDYAPLRRLILDGRLAAGAMTVSKTNMKNVVLKINAKNGVIRLNPFSLDAYQGNIAGSGIFNVQRDTPVSNLQLNVKNLQVGPLLRDHMQKDLLEGITYANIKLNMVGDEPQRIMQSLGGNGELRFNDGAIVGLDLAGMARNLQAAFGLESSSGERPRTDFSELTAPFTINKGVVTTTRTSMKSPFLRLLASGTADLVKERLNMRIEPKLVGTIKGQGDEKQRSGITVPVLVSGTFSEPKFKPDLKAVANQQIEKEVFENKEVKKIFKKKELQPYEDTAKDLIKGLFDN